MNVNLEPQLTRNFILFSQHLPGGGRADNGKRPILLSPPDPQTHTTYSNTGLEVGVGGAHKLLSPLGLPLALVPSKASWGLPDPLTPPHTHTHRQVIAEVSWGE